MYFVHTSHTYIHIHTYVYIIFSNSFKDNEVPSTTNQLSEVYKLATTFNASNNERPTSLIVHDDYEEKVTPLGYSVIDTDNVRKKSSTYQ